MIENQSVSNREPAVVQKPSYLVGAAAGAAAGAVALNLYISINPLFLGSAAELASAYIAGNEPTVRTLLMTGAAVGAIAGAIRTAVDRRWSTQKDVTIKVAIDAATGLAAAPMATIGKCMLFPMASELWKEVPFIAHTLTCSAIGGLTATVIAPVGIAASTASRLANQYFAKKDIKSE